MKHSFSIEMKSKKHVRHISLSNESHERVLFEGTLGKLMVTRFIESSVLELKGTNGTIRIDISQEELRNILVNQKAESEQCEKG